MTPDEFVRLWDQFVGGLPEAIASARFQATQQLETDIKQRIFSASGTKDIDGNTRKYRSKEHIEARRAEGLQVNVVDHDFKGDLKRGVQKVETERQYVLKINGALNVEKARDNEHLYPAGVFEASELEEERTQKVYEEVMGEYINKFFN